jgi:hypothetical protein
MVLLHVNHWPGNNPKQKRVLYQFSFILQRNPFLNFSEANFLAHHLDRSFRITNTCAVESILIHMKAKAIEVMIEQWRTQNE